MCHWVFLISSLFVLVLHNTKMFNILVLTWVKRVHRTRKKHLTCLDTSYTCYQHNVIFSIFRLIPIGDSCWVFKWTYFGCSKYSILQTSTVYIYFDHTRKTWTVPVLLSITLNIWTIKYFLWWFLLTMRIATLQEYK